MKKLILLIILFFSPLVHAFSQQDLVTLLQKPQNVQGKFSQQRYLKALTKPMTTSGQFVLLANKGLLWQLEKPFANQLRVRQDGIMQWNGSLWQGNNQFGQASQIQLFLDLLAGNVNGLAEQFELQLSGTQKQWQLTLQPNTLLMKQIFNQITIKGDELVREIELDEKQGDRTLILFSELRTNSPLSDFAKESLH